MSNTTIFLFETNFAIYSYKKNFQDSLGFILYDSSSPGAHWFPAYYMSLSWGMLNFFFYVPLQCNIILLFMIHGIFRIIDQNTECSNNLCYSQNMQFYYINFMYKCTIVVWFWNSLYRIMIWTFGPQLVALLWRQCSLIDNHWEWAFEPYTKHWFQPVLSAPWSTKKWTALPHVLATIKGATPTNAMMDWNASKTVSKNKPFFL